MFIWVINQLNLSSISPFQLFQLHVGSFNKTETILKGINYIYSSCLLSLFTLQLKQAQDPPGSSTERSVWRGLSSTLPSILNQNLDVVVPEERRKKKKRKKRERFQRSAETCTNLLQCRKRYIYWLVDGQRLFGSISQFLLQFGLSPSETEIRGLTRYRTRDQSNFLQVSCLPAVLLVLGVQPIGLLSLLCHPPRHQLLVVLRGFPQFLLQGREGDLQGIILVLQGLIRPLQVLQNTGESNWVWRSPSLCLMY